MMWAVHVLDRRESPAARAEEEDRPRTAGAVADRAPLLRPFGASDRAVVEGQR
jgi:hypothetical protein